MKTKLAILLFLLFPFFSMGQNNVIQVRKVTYDTSFYTNKTYDTASIVTSDKLEITAPLNGKRSGYWRNNVFFDNDSIYVFSRIISKRQKKLAEKKPVKFWKKIERKKNKRRNKCLTFSIGYQFFEVLTTYQIDTITTTHYQITNNSTFKTVRNDSLVIFRDTTSYNLEYRNYFYVSDYDSILLTRTREGFALNGTDFRNFNGQFSSLATNLKNHYKLNRPFGFYKYSGKIDNKRCQMYLGMESHLMRKAVVIENNQTRHYCDFDLTKDSLFIYNSPIGEIHTGRVARKKNKIRFRNDRKNYNFYQKNRGYYGSNKGKNSGHYYYYHYSVAL